MGRQVSRAHRPAGLLWVGSGRVWTQGLQAATYRVVVPVPARVPHGSPVSGLHHPRLGREDGVRPHGSPSPLLEAHQQAGPPLPAPGSPSWAARTWVRRQPNQRGLEWPAPFSAPATHSSPQDPQANMNILGVQPSKLKLPFPFPCLLAGPIRATAVTSPQETPTSLLLPPYTVL